MFIFKKYLKEWGSELSDLFSWWIDVLPNYLLQSYPKIILLSQSFHKTFYLINRKNTSRNSSRRHINDILIPGFCSSSVLTRGLCSQLACCCLFRVSIQHHVGVMMHRKASGGVNKLSVDSSCGVNNTYLCSRCSEHSYTSPPSPQGDTEPSVPRLPAPVRVTSPPVCTSVPSPSLPSISCCYFIGGLTQVQEQDTKKVYSHSISQIMPLRLRLC